MPSAWIPRYEPLPTYQVWVSSPFLQRPLVLKQVYKQCKGVLIACCLIPSSNPLKLIEFEILLCGPIILWQSWLLKGTTMGTAYQNSQMGTCYMLKHNKSFLDSYPVAIYLFWWERRLVKLGWIKVHRLSWKGLQASLHPYRFLFETIQSDHDLHYP